MAVEICPNEGKVWVATNVISGATVYAGLIYGQTVAGGQITALSLLTGLQEENSTGYARMPLTLGAVDPSGIIAIPGYTWNNGANAWRNNEMAWFISNLSTPGTGKAIFVWDLAATRDMSTPGTSFPVGSLNWFFANVGEV
jgi:hypothetical protein